MTTKTKTKTLADILAPLTAEERLAVERLISGTDDLIVLARAVVDAANRRRGSSHFEVSDVELSARFGDAVTWEARIGAGVPGSPRWDAEASTPAEALRALARAAS
jgi:hypothetical protein